MLLIPVKILFFWVHSLQKFFLKFKFYLTVLLLCFLFMRAIFLKSHWHIFTQHFIRFEKCNKNAILRSQGLVRDLWKSTNWPFLHFFCPSFASSLVHGFLHFSFSKRVGERLLMFEKFCFCVEYALAVLQSDLCAFFKVIWPKFDKGRTSASPMR